MPFSKKVRSLDLFKKVPIDISRPTNLGGFVSILTGLIILYLFSR